ncbi:hypothetical protein CDD83_2638 [Cordyceps sp. RAO-2017]|nr:hypothetical protein CDD83_2638 [Cordyceps sp. RAO-2017]
MSQGLNTLRKAKEEMQKARYALKVARGQPHEGKYFHVYKSVAELKVLLREFDAALTLLATLEKMAQEISCDVDEAEIEIKEEQFVKEQRGREKI